MRELEDYEIEGACGLIANIAACCNEDGSVPALEDLDVGRKALVYERARRTLNLLTAGVVANCGVTVRPCPPRCVAASTSWSWGGLTWVPQHLGMGVWVNLCGCSTVCDCAPSNQITLPGPIAEVTEVQVDGVVLDPETYRLEEAKYLVGDEPWPTEQDMDVIAGVGVFSVDYRPGVALGIAGEAAYGALICEYAKLECGQACALPSSVKRIQRQGVAYDVDVSPFPKGLTHIRAVDDFILSINPHGLKTLPTVWTPGRKGYRVVT